MQYRVSGMDCADCATQIEQAAGNVADMATTLGVAGLVYTMQHITNPSCPMAEP